MSMTKSELIHMLNATADEILKLQKALQFYANGNHYEETHPMAPATCIEFGEKAKEALK